MGRRKTTVKSTPLKISVDSGKQLNKSHYNHFISRYCPFFFSNSECINGTHTCFVNYTVDENQHLSNSSLENLKNQLIQVFNFQFNHREHLQVDIRHINKYPTHGKHCRSARLHVIVDLLLWGGALGISFLDSQKLD